MQNHFMRVFFSTVRVHGNIWLFELSSAILIKLHGLYQYQSLAYGSSQIIFKG